MAGADVIRVNRAPVLTLWAAVVAERLGCPAPLALTLGRAVAGYSAQAKALRLGLREERDEAPARKPRLAPPETMLLLGRRIPVLRGEDGGLRAEEHGKAASELATLSYVKRAFGDRLSDVRAAMEALAESYAPDELNRVGFHLYEHFRPEIPEGVRGWGAKGELRLDRIRNARA